MEVVAVVIAGLSLALSIFTLYRQWLANRQAAIEVRLEVHGEPGSATSPTSRRVVLYNHGPHEAHQVDFRLLDRDGVPLDRIADAHVLPLPDLYAQQDFHVRLRGRQLGEEKLLCAEVTWSDGRPGQHNKRVWLIPRKVQHAPLASGDPRLPRRRRRG